MSPPSPMPWPFPGRWSVCWRSRNEPRSSSPNCSVMPTSPMWPNARPEEVMHEQPQATPLQSRTPLPCADAPVAAAHVGQRARPGPVATAPSSPLQRRSPALHHPSRALSGEPAPAHPGRLLDRHVAAAAAVGVERAQRGYPQLAGGAGGMSDNTKIKRAALYVRVSTTDQHPETQLHDLEAMAQQRGLEIVQRYSDQITGTRARRPGLDQMLADARRGQFDIVLVWACDRVARSTRHFLEVLDELNHLNVDFASFREQIDTAGPLGRAVVVIIGAIAELERGLIVERVRAGMRRAKLEGRHIGRRPLNVDRSAVLRDRQRGLSLTDVAKAHRISRAFVSKIVREARHPAGHEGVGSAHLQPKENRAAI